MDGAALPDSSPSPGDPCRPRTALVTGAASGIGRASAHALHAAGFQVVALDRDEAGLATLPSAMQRRAVDLRNPTDLRGAIDDAGATLAALVLNGAVVSPAAAVQDTTEDEVDLIEAVNMRATYRALKWAFPHLQATKGCVVAVSSMAGVTGQAGHALYAASKGWLNALVRATAVDWGPHGIRINTVAPCGVMTPAMEGFIAAQPQPETMDAVLRAQHALGRPAQPEEIAAVVAFLCSDGASFMTGAVVPVSGGSECGYRA